MAVDPQAHDSFFCTDVVVVPLVGALAVVGGGEAASAIGCSRREGAHMDILANRKNITVAGEPVGLTLAVFFIVLFVAEIENLAFDTLRKPAFAGSECIQAFFGGPDKDTRVAAVLFVFPFTEQFKINERLM